MVFTGKLGTADSQLGSIVPGSAGEAAPDDLRTATDSVVTSDSVAVAQTLSRGLTDSTGVSDELAHFGPGVDYQRTAEDSAPASDTVARSHGFRRLLADAVGTTDGIASRIGRVRLVFQSASATDALAATIAVAPGNPPVLIKVVTATPSVSPGITALSSIVGIAADDIIVYHLVVHGARRVNPSAPGWERYAGPVATNSGIQSWVFWRRGAGITTEAFSVPGGELKMGRSYQIRGAAASAFPFGDFAWRGDISATVLAPGLVTEDGSLALALIAVADDNALDVFTGETGGDWLEPVPEVTTTLGTNGAIGTGVATTVSGGTIAGGSDAMSASDPWHVLGLVVLSSVPAGDVRDLAAPYTDELLSTGTHPRPLSDSASATDTLVHRVQLDGGRLLDETLVTSDAVATLRGRLERFEETNPALVFEDDFNAIVSGLGPDWYDVIDLYLVSGYVEVAVGGWGEALSLTPILPLPATIQFDFWVPPDDDEPDAYHAYEFDASQRYLLVEVVDGQWSAFVHGGEDLYLFDPAPDTWYRVKAYVSAGTGDPYRIKVWPRDDPEPEWGVEDVHTQSAYEGFDKHYIYLDAWNAIYPSRMDNLRVESLTSLDEALATVGLYPGNVTDDVSVGVISFADQVLALTPAHYWRFDGAAGVPPLVATVGVNLTQLTSSAVTTDGLLHPSHANGAHVFEMWDLAAEQNTAAFSLGNQFTIMALVRRDVLGVEQRIVSKGHGAYGLKFRSDNKIAVDGQSLGVSCVSSFTITDNDWHLIVGLHTPAQDAIYLDGVLDPSSTASVRSYSNVNDDLTVARDNSFFSGGEFEGAIGELALFGRGLTSGEVAQLWDRVARPVHEDLTSRIGYVRRPTETLVTSAVLQAQHSDTGEPEGDIPDGYLPVLATPWTPGETTVTVSAPGPTDVPFAVTINGHAVVVTAVNGNVWTIELVSGGTAPTGTPVLPALANITVDGVDITRDVDYHVSKFMTYANGQVGTCQIRVRDLAGTWTFVTGAEIVVRFRGIRMWAGFVSSVARSYAFPAGTGGTVEPRYLTLEGVDYNILLAKRVFYNPADPEDMTVRRWPNGTPDSVVLSEVLSSFLDLEADGISFDVQHVGTPALPTVSCNPDAPDVFGVGSAGWTWLEVMKAISSQTGAIYYIDPDKVFRYVDDSTKQSRFGYAGVTDAPAGTMVGYRDLEIVHDGSQLLNDQWTWGVGQGSAAPVLGHFEDAASQAEHGLWQAGELRYDMYCQSSVDLRAETWVNGSPQNRRGGKDDKVVVRCTVFVPYFRVADVVTFESTTFGITDDMPVRGAEISFPTPWSIQAVLTISHEIDAPWTTYEFFFPTYRLNFPAFPAFPFGIPPFALSLPNLPYPFPPWDPCLILGSILVPAEEAAASHYEFTSDGIIDADAGKPSHIVTEGQFGFLNYIEHDKAHQHWTHSPDTTCVENSTRAGDDTPPVWARREAVWTDLYHVDFTSAVIDVEGELERAHAKSFVRHYLAPTVLADQNRPFYLESTWEITVEAYLYDRLRVNWLSGWHDIVKHPWPENYLAMDFGIIKDPVLTVCQDIERSGIAQTHLIPLTHGAETSTAVYTLQFNHGPMSKWHRFVASIIDQGELDDSAGIVTVKANMVDWTIRYMDQASGFPPEHPCFGAAPGELQDPPLNPGPSGGSATGEAASRGPASGSGSVYFFTEHQFQPHSTEVWVGGIRIRLGDDYVESWRLRRIEILSHISVGPVEAPIPVTVNYVPWVVEHPVAQEPI